MQGMKNSYSFGILNYGNGMLLMVLLLSSEFKRKTWKLKKNKQQYNIAIMQL